MTPDKRIFMTLLSSTLLLAACEVPLLDDQARIDARREAEGKAIGGACRHVGRALEECYERSPRVSKAAIFAGWRDMDGYMRENNIQVVSPEMPAEPPAKQGESAEDKPKAAEAPPVEEKPKAAEAASGKKSAEVPPAKKSVQAPKIKPAVPVGGKPFHEFGAGNRFSM